MENNYDRCIRCIWRAAGCAGPDPSMYECSRFVRELEIKTPDGLKDLPEMHTPSDEEIKEMEDVLHLASKGWTLIMPGVKLSELISKVIMMRKAQKKHRETLVYGYRSTSIRLEKEVDELLKQIKQNGNESD